MTSMVKMMKPYRSEPAKELGCANTGIKLASIAQHGELCILDFCALSDLVQNNISLKITFEFSSLVFVLCSS